MSDIVLDADYIMVSKIDHCPCPNGVYKVNLAPLFSL